MVKGLLGEAEEKKGCRLRVYSDAGLETLETGLEEIMLKYDRGHFVRTALRRSRNTYIADIKAIRREKSAMTICNYDV
jgi:hypothetical protein